MMKANADELERSNRRAGRLLEITLEGVPRGRQADTLRDELRGAIRRGSLPAGTRLPATRTLAADLGVSRGVVVRAYEHLTAAGYLHAQQGRGTEVAAIPATATAVPVADVRPATNPGLPGGSSFPRTAWLRAAHRALETLPDADLSYGDPAGHPRLRQELSSYLGRVRALTAPPDRIVVVNGFAQASRLLSEILQERGIDRLALEDPGSVGLQEQLAGAGMACIPVPVDEYGLRVDALADSGCRAVVVTPAHQFPTGVVMSPERRHELLAWARDTGGIVIEDDYDAEYRYDRTPVGALQGLAPDVVVYGGSVSKILAPGLRIGWVVVPGHLVGAVRAAKYAADLATGILEQATLAEFVASGEMDRHIRRTRTQHRRRRDRLVAALTEHLPAWQVRGTAAGLHLLVHPPRDCDEAEVAALARACGLDARPLRAYTFGVARPAGLVVGYGHQHPDALSRAVSALGRRWSEATPPPVAWPADERARRQAKAH